MRAHLSSFAFLALTCLSTATGCGAGANQGVAHPTRKASVISPVADGDFAESLRKVLATPPRTEAERALALGVARRQLIFAGRRFAQGDEVRGTKSVLGALFLLEGSEASPDLVDRETKDAWLGAMRKLSARGDVGKSKALLTLLSESTALDAAAKAEVGEHLKNLNAWSSATFDGAPIERAAELERMLVDHALLLPSEETLSKSSDAISTWIDQAIVLNVQFRESGRRPTQPEAVEATRALETGALTLIALSARAEPLERLMPRIAGSSAKRVIEPELFRSIEQLADAPDADAMRELFATVDSQSERRIGGEIGLDADLIDAALFRLSIHAYRLDSRHFATTFEIARRLISFGMSDAVPLILADGLEDKTDKNQVMIALRVFATALAAEESARDYDAARRVMNNASPLFKAALAGAPDVARSVIAETRYQMAGIYMRGGFLEDAKRELEAALGDAPNTDGYLLSARVERQLGNTKGALVLSQKAILDRSADPLEAAEANLLAFEIFRSDGKTKEAEQSLAKALSLTLDALKKRPAPAPYRVRGERILGQILLGFGDTQAAFRAFERAMNDVGTVRGLVGVTMLRFLGAALLAGDVDKARAALRKGRDAGATREDLVYGALWVMLAERRTSTKADGSARDIFEESAASPTWTGRLASWGLGRLDEATLLKSAKTEAERVEAKFYVAMARHVGGDVSAKSTLSEVASGRVIDLLEVDLARELTAPSFKAVPPKGVVIP